MHPARRTVSRAPTCRAEVRRGGRQGRSAGSAVAPGLGHPQRRRDRRLVRIPTAARASGPQRSPPDAGAPRSKGGRTGMFGDATRGVAIAKWIGSPGPDDEVTAPPLAAPVVVPRSVSTSTGPRRVAAQLPWAAPSAPDSAPCPPRRRRSQRAPRRRPTDGHGVPACPGGPREGEQGQQVPAAAGEGEQRAHRGSRGPDLAKPISVHKPWPLQPSHQEVP